MASSYIGGGVATPAVDSSEPHTTASETPAPIQALQPPASNAGSDDPSAGIAKDAGGVSSTAGIGSPVTAETERQTVVGSVLEYAFGKKERTAEETDAAAPTTDTVTAGTAGETTSSTTATSSGTYLGAIAAAGGAAVASIIPGMASTTGAEPHAATTSSTATEPTASSTTPADVKSTTAVTEDKPLTEKAAEATESAKESVSETAQAAKETVTGEKKEEGEKDPEALEKAKKVSDHEAATRENVDAIPTAGGEQIGAAHAGESKVIPDVPPTPAEDSAAISSTAGQPDTTTADNTAKNTGSAEKQGLPLLGGKKNGTEGSSSDKPKFMDRLKNKLHIGDKKDKS